MLSGMLSRMASDVDRRRLLSYRGKQTVDGLGADRVVRIIGSLIEERFKTGNRRGSDD